MRLGVILTSFKKIPKNSPSQTPVWDGTIMRTDFKIYNSHYPHFITSTIVEWISIFKGEKYINIFIDNFRFYQGNKGLKIFAYVIMENHFHMICQHENLSRIISDFKKITAKQIINQLRLDNNFSKLEKFAYHKKNHKTESNYQIWQEGFHPQQILSQEMFNQKAEYIHFNPVKNNLVENMEDWKYSSAGFYLKGIEGIISIDKF